MSTLKDRVEEALRAGFTKTQLAEAVDATSATVSHWLAERTKKLSAQSAVGLARLTGWTVAYWESGKLPRVERVDGMPLAHPMSFAPVTMPPITKWEDLLEMAELPPMFSVVMPDDALSDSVPRGIEIVFDCHRAPELGRVILVKDSKERMHIRRMGQGADDDWTAQATNQVYKTLHSERDGLVVLAVARYIGC